MNLFERMLFCRTPSRDAMAVVVSSAVLPPAQGTEPVGVSVGVGPSANPASEVGRTHHFRREIRGF